MRMRELIYHKHYWSIPHSREIDNRIIQICYDCGKERVSPISLGFREPDGYRGPDEFQHPDGFQGPDGPDGRSEEPPVNLESGDNGGPGLRHPQPHWDILEAIGKRFYWKKKLAGG
jgi:hypothetical protein